jgi:hypothetical protein
MSEYEDIIDRLSSIIAAIACVIVVFGGTIIVRWITMTATPFWEDFIKNSIVFGLAFGAVRYLSRRRSSK